MHIFVNALSARSLSGQHVLFGHVRQLAIWTESTHTFTILVEEGESIEDKRFTENVQSISAPAFGNNWIKRTLWERLKLPSILKVVRADVLFTPTGTIQSRYSIPQVSLAQNPWCMMPGMQTTFKENLKATIQRAAYRKAYRFADRMIYNSQHMRDLYQKNAGLIPEAPHSIVYQGIEDETHDLAERMRQSTEKIPFSILTVSVMAPWKNVEATVSTLALLHNKNIPATLALVGPWADHSYRKKIEQQIKDLKLKNAVIITGKVSREELHEHYATAMVYCLMSRCESFGIPAVEAQAFGTPVVGSNVCAMPEIGGRGGFFHSPDNVNAIADSLDSLLTDKPLWESYHQAAVENSKQYRWKECSKPLLHIFSPEGLSTDLPELGNDEQINQAIELSASTVKS